MEHQTQWQPLLQLNVATHRTQRLYATCRYTPNSAAVRNSNTQILGCSPTRNIHPQLAGTTANATITYAVRSQIFLSSQDFLLEQPCCLRNPFGATVCSATPEVRLDEVCLCVSLRGLLVSERLGVSCTLVGRVLDELLVIFLCILLSNSSS
jgi:hypothetical protein